MENNAAPKRSNQDNINEYACIVWSIFLKMETDNVFNETIIQ